MKIVLHSLKITITIYIIQRSAKLLDKQVDIYYY